MAARRLIIVLVVLFVASVIAAALAPERRGSLLGDETSSTTTTSTTTTEDSAGEEPDPDPPADARRSMRLVASTQRPAVGRAQVGDQVELQVRSDSFVQLEIPAFGITGNASPNAPARFSLMLRDSGEIPILAARSGKTAARILVAEPGEREGRGSQAQGTKRPEPDKADPGR